MGQPGAVGFKVASCNAAMSTSESCSHPPAQFKHQNFVIAANSSLAIQNLVVKQKSIRFSLAFSAYLQAFSGFLGQLNVHGNIATI
jgi:hypothetical protein